MTLETDGDYEGREPLRGSLPLSIALRHKDRGQGDGVH
jgi:hypothetical protein